MCRRVSPACAVCVCAAERPPRLPPRTRTLTRTHTLTDPRRARRPRVCVFFLAASHFPTDCVRISYRSAPISAILGKLHKNKPSGLFLPEAGKCFGKRGGAGPRRPSARGRAQGAGRAGSPRRRGVRPAPCRAAPGRVRARACVGRRRARVGGLGGEARGCFSCNLFTPSLYWGGREGSEAGPPPASRGVRVPFRNNGFCTLASWARPAVLAPRRLGGGK